MGLGTCVQWHADIERWDVEVVNQDPSTGTWGHQILSLKPENLKSHRDLHLVSNAGWRGKTVHSWVSADAQEDVSQGVPTRLITVHGISSVTGERVVCSNIAGEEVAVVAASFQNATFAQVKAAVAKSCCCETSEVQLITAAGHVLHCGVDSWTLAEAMAYGR